MTIWHLQLEIVGILVGQSLALVDYLHIQNLYLVYNVTHLYTKI